MKSSDGTNGCNGQGVWHYFLSNGTTHGRRIIQLISISAFRISNIGICGIIKQYSYGFRHVLDQYKVLEAPIVNRVARVASSSPTTCTTKVVREVADM